jgi:hypothetical protein
MLNSMPTGGYVEMEDGRVRLMQWMDRDKYEVIIIDDISSSISGPWDIDNLKFEPQDPLMALRISSEYSKCMRNT